MTLLQRCLFPLLALLLIGCAHQGASGYMVRVVDVKLDPSSARDKTVANFPVLSNKALGLERLKEEVRRKVKKEGQPTLASSAVAMRWRRRPIAKKAILGPWREESQLQTRPDVRMPKGKHLKGKVSLRFVPTGEEGWGRLHAHVAYRYDDREKIANIVRNFMTTYIETLFEKGVEAVKKSARRAGARAEFPPAEGPKK